MLPVASSLILLLAPLPGIPQDDSGTGWTMTNLDLEVILLPAEERFEMVGTMGLRNDGAASLGPTIALNGDTDVVRFVALEGPSGTGVELAQGFRGIAGVRLAHVRAEEPYAGGAEVELFFEAVSAGRASQTLVTESIALGSWTDVWHPMPLPAPGEALSSKLKTVGTTTFHLPPGWTAPCNGERTEHEATEDGVREVWAIDVPVARSFAAGPFHVALKKAGERRIRVHRLGAIDQGESLHAVAAAAAVEAMEARLGPFPYDDFSIVEVPADLVTWYAASQQGHIWATSGVFRTGDGNLPLWGHEMAHGWWGNLVGTAGDGSLLCSESLAQYGAVISIETVDGPEAMREFLSFSRDGYPSLQCARGYFQIWRDGNDEPLSGMQGGGWNHQLSDAKGHWVYHMLRGRVGDELFFATLRGLISDFAGRMLTLADLRAAFVGAAPEEAELEAFFAQWLDRAGAPILEARKEEDELVITQVQAGAPYHLQLEVDLVRASGEEALLIDVRERETRVPLTAEDPVGEVRLDPRQRLLIWRSEYGDRP
jgi:hypothetical protein